MTASNAHGLRPLRRLAAHRWGALVLAIALASGSAPVLAAAAAPAGAAQAAPVQVSDVDFRRSEDGAGRLILKFDRKGAVPDLRTDNGKVIIDMANVTLPASLQRPMNVTDFATPVQRIDAHVSGKGAQLVLDTRGTVESLAYQTEDQYVVEISQKSGKPAMGAAAQSSGASQLAAGGVKPYVGKPVTFNFQDVPVRTVLQLIAEESNLNIVASDTVQGSVTLRLVNVPWDQALDIVLRAKGLDKRRDGNVVWVAPQPELAKFEQDKEDARIAIENREDLITDYVQINYHSATEIYKALTEAKGIGSQGGNGGQNNQENGFLSSRGRLVADERTNTLMISDIPKKVASMRELIAVIDRPVDQVLIEARIVVATDTFARDLGAKFGIGGTHTYGDNVATIGSGVTGGADSATRGLNVNMPAGGFTTGNVSSVAYTLLGTNFNLDLELSALQQEGRGEVVSNPRIITANQREGDIKQGTEIGYVTITGGTAGTAATPNVQFKEALLELKVTPTITHDGRIFLNMFVKKDDIAELIKLDGYGTVPTLNRREINTAVLVEDGQTVVIGGVYEFTDRASVSKVPFLADIPFLGNLFKSQGKQKNKAELLIFVTPKVISVRQ
ncbi:type IV pilus secretin PilQ [Pseudoxanthomonas winnipegensis]|uniref:Type IV pilus secretin PilQ family protein n=1 Tax=Pseudoxanthomonas winnipegensis TaxID=2480810 RepID=A0A4Q8LMD0_9GAMM|nr:type IV pilus secretin PilQ family protein [Pseudoxanthomonas winnipegensis]RZZ83507.1 type IV pilus secretin PilQ family protein [Pseudoxanthomonas winnipegensis]TAA31759.1 type IV pilus secretin PilQ family protein [Pseudoxanthomonas winnipegensis]